MIIEEIVYKLWHMLLLRILFAALAAVLGTATGPLSDWIVKRAAMRLPQNMRAEMEKQWLADFHDLAAWLRLKSALSVWLAGPRLYVDLCKSNSKVEGLEVVDLNLLRCRIQFKEVATRDALTGFMNRRSFERALRVAIARDRHPTFLVLLDVDHLKPVNDVMGHSAGDALLQELARRIERGLRVGDQVCRYGGDEFAILMRKGTSPEEVQRVAEAVRQTCDFAVVGPPFRGEGIRELKVSTSVGIASTQRRPDLNEIQSEADAALYCAKKEGRNCVRVYLRPRDH